MRKYKLIHAKQIVEDNPIEDNPIKMGYMKVFTGGDPFYARRDMFIKTPSKKPFNLGLQKIIYGGADITNKN